MKNNLKRIGMVGGLAWPSTIDYYRLLCQRTNDHFRKQGAELPYPTPPMVIESVNIAETRPMRGEEGNDNSWRAFDNFFRETLSALQRAGADFGFIASNTPHMRFDAITEGVDLPLVSILDTTAAAVAGTGANRALVLGTPVTMRSDAYPRALERNGIRALASVPEETIVELADLIDVDLYQGRIEGASEKIAEISRRHLLDDRVDIVCLACTELPLAFPEHSNDAIFVEDGITYINTTVAHVEAVLELALS